MEIIIRQEKESDYKKVFDLTEKAFANMEFSDKDEQFLVERLRKSDVFIPELSLVAECKGEVVGHILLTKLKIVNGEREFESLSLAPVSVFPEFQNKGIGSRLIKAAHKKAKELGCKSVILVGHENYYPRFGYELTSKFGITFPYDFPDINCMAIELVKGALENVSGEVKFPKEFYEQD